MESDDRMTSSIRTDRALWHRARMKAMSAGMTISEAVERLLRDWTREDPAADGKRRVLLDVGRSKEERPSRRSLEEDDTSTKKGTNSRFRGRDPDD